MIGQGIFYIKNEFIYKIRLILAWIVGLTTQTINASDLYVVFVARARNPNNLSLKILLLLTILYRAPKFRLFYDINGAG